MFLYIVLLKVFISLFCSILVQMIFPTGATIKEFLACYVLNNSCFKSETVDVLEVGRPIFSVDERTNPYFVRLALKETNDGFIKSALFRSADSPLFYYI